MSLSDGNTHRPGRLRPAVDDRIVMPETRHEVVDGEVRYVSPADQPHGSRHSKLSALLEAFVAAGYDVASDMLTRTSERSDFAPDASVYPAAPDPETGGRRLEELAFEVVSTRGLAAAGRKAAALVGRGVRRVFAMDVERQSGLEWSSRTDAWEILSRQSAIVDPALALPLPVHDLVVAAKADDAIARALLAKQNPVLVEALGEARGAGKAEGKAEAILTVLRSRRIPITETEERRILETRDHALLDSWLAVAAACGSAAELLAGRHTHREEDVEGG